MSQRALLASLMAVGIALATGGAASAQNAPRDTASYFAADIVGANEVPAADPDGSGKAFVRIKGTEVCFVTTWSNIAAPTAGHIHSGVAGVSGPVRVPFFAGALPDNLTGLLGCQASDQATVDAIKADPAAFYVNLHNVEFRAGAVRGQLRKLNRPVDLDRELNHGTLAAFATGAQEFPGPGDPDAFSAAFFSFSGTTVKFAVSWKNITPPMAAHIHPGAPGTAQPPAVPLFASPTGIPATITAVTGTATGTADVLNDIQRHPRNYYYNVHTTDFPGGAARGQLTRICF
jgi:hypothetical protein